MTKEEKIEYVEKRIAENRGNIKALQRMLANLQEYGEVRQPEPKWTKEWKLHDFEH